jgi:hypothetical protein
MLNDSSVLAAAEDDKSSAVEDEFVVALYEWLFNTAPSSESVLKFWRSSIGPRIALWPTAATMRS